MFLDAERSWFDVELLHQAGGGAEVMETEAAGRAQFEAMGVRAAVEEFGGEELPQVGRMARLSAGLLTICRRCLLITLWRLRGGWRC